MPEQDEDLIQLQLEKEREVYQTQLKNEEEEKAQAPNKMGWGIFLLSLVLTLIQLGLEWLDFGLIGWIPGAIISAGLWFMLRKYNKSLKTGRWLLGSSLVTDSLPFIGLIPVDILAIIFVFIKSRSAHAEHLLKLAERVTGKEA